MASITGKVGKFLGKAFSLERVLALVLLGGLIVLQTTDPYPTQFLRLKTFDFYQQVKPRPIPKPEEKLVTIIDLDEESLRRVGQWPWPRNILAELVRRLTQMGALQVAFDIAFAEPDRMNPDGVVGSLAGLDAATKAKILKLPSNDRVFGSMIRQSNVVLGQAVKWKQAPDEGKRAPVKKSVAIKGPKPHSLLPNAPALVRNVDEIEKYAKGHGIFSLVPEPDGIIRRVPSLFVHGKDMYPSLPIEMIRVMFKRPTILVESDVAGVKALGIVKGFKIPTDRNGRIWPYFSKMDKAKYVSAVDVLTGEADPNLIRGKLTILGTSAVGLLDIRAIPTEPVIPGVEVHAQMVESIIKVNMAAKRLEPAGQFLSRPALTSGAEIMLLLISGLLMVWLVPKLGAKWTLILLLVVAGGSAYSSWYFFSEKRILFDVGFVILSVLAIYILLSYMGYASEEASKKETRNAFSKYLSPDMVNVIAENPAQLKLGGDQREMTLLFCDVRGFTTISEQFDAIGLTALINKLLTPLTNVILGLKGTVDKYMGDCIMAFWNAPLDDPDHARNACLAALDMLAEMQPLNDRLEVEAKEEGRKHIPLKVGIGLNTGTCVVGNMGSDQRFDYSVLGDTVNLASRLEGQSKNYGLRIVIGESTKTLAADMATIELDLIKVKGKTEAVRIFSLLGDDKMAATPEFQALTAKVDEMLAKYRAQDWAGARAACAEARILGADHNIDGFFDLYEERFVEGEANPPGADWDGVFVATTK